MQVYANDEANIYKAITILQPSQYSLKPVHYDV